MKKILLITSLFFGAFANAQIKSGIIKYEMVTSLALNQKEGGPEIPEAILAMMPKEIKKQKQLKFNEAKSIYENQVVKKDESKEEDEPQDMGGGMKMMFKAGGPGDGAKEKTLTDLSLNKQLEYKEFFGKDFLVVTDTLKKTQWKPTGKQKLLLNYPCYEALSIGEVRGKQDTITAWYTTAIATKSGPKGFNGLPGMILQVQMGTLISITATEVLEQNITTNDLEMPSGGKKVTAAEFKEISDKKMKEMGMEKGKPKIMFHAGPDMQ